MIRKILKSSSGVTLAEVLVILGIISLIGLLITSYLVGGMKSYRSVNKDISLHDEANYVMQQFSNYIFVATNVVDEDQTGGNSIIKVTTIKDSNINELETTTLGFDYDGKAVINGNPISQPGFLFSFEDPKDPGTKKKSKITIENNTVIIEMFIQEGGKVLKMESKVSYVKVNDEVGGS